MLQAFDEKAQLSLSQPVENMVCQANVCSHCIKSEGQATEIRRRKRCRHTLMLCLVTAEHRVRSLIKACTWGTHNFITFGATKERTPINAKRFQ